MAHEIPYQPQRGSFKTTTQNVKTQKGCKLLLLQTEECNFLLLFCFIILMLTEEKNPCLKYNHLKSVSTLNVGWSLDIREKG